MIGALTQWGYEVIRPEGTFYLFGRAWGGDSDSLFDALADRDVFVMPGRVLATPQHFRSEEHTSELQSLMRISYAVFCLKKKKKQPSKYTYNLIQLMTKKIIT